MFRVHHVKVLLCLLFTKTQFKLGIVLYKVPVQTLLGHGHFETTKRWEADKLENSK